MRSNDNSIHIEGRVYKFDLKEKVFGPTSAQAGAPYISGKLEVATDEEGLNVIPVTFRFVTEYYSKSGKPNSTYKALKTIMANNKTWEAVGKDAATMVSINGRLNLNDFYSSLNEELVAAKIYEGSFLNIVSSIAEEEKERNKFTVDVVINNTNIVEADPDKYIDSRYLELRGVVFTFRNEILPYEFRVQNEEGIKYFEKFDITGANPLYTKIWGRIISTEKTIMKETESAFGEAAVRPVPVPEKALEVIGGAKVPYDFGDPEVLTGEDLRTASQNREIHLATVKKNAEDYQQSKAAASANGAAGVSIGSLAGNSNVSSGSFFF